MLSKADRDKPQTFCCLRKSGKPSCSSQDLADITIEDAYAISTEVTRRKIAAGAKLIGHKMA